MEEIFEELRGRLKIMRLKLRSDLGQVRLWRLCKTTIKLKPMRDELMGQYNRGMLHGGAISSVIDVAGGLSAFIGLQKKMQGETLEARLRRYSRVSTIDIRVDFLRPGLGKWFVATGYVLRTGNRIAVTRIELHNDQNQLVAAGTGSYSVA